MVCAATSLLACPARVQAADLTAPTNSQSVKCNETFTFSSNLCSVDLHCQRQ